MYVYDYWFSDILVKVLPRTGPEGPEGKLRYSSTLSLTSKLDGSGWSTPSLGPFIPEKDPVPIVQEAGWAPGPVWPGEENLVPTGIRSPDRPARRQSLYRLSYPAHVKGNFNFTFYLQLLVTVHGGHGQIQEPSNFGEDEPTLITLFNKI